MTPPPRCTRCIEGIAKDECAHCAAMAASLLAAWQEFGISNDQARASIRRAVDWSRTSKGGRNFDLMENIADASPHMCESAYGLCE